MNTNTWVFYNEETSTYLGMDENSGGYAYTTTHLTAAALWENLEDAVGWYDMMQRRNPGYKLTHLKLDIQEK